MSCSNDSVLKWANGAHL